MRIGVDIDGVLNSDKTFKERYIEYNLTKKWFLEMDLDMLNNLKTIIEKTDAKIVLSSSWRIFMKKENGIIKSDDDKGKKLLELFKLYGIEIYDMTPYRQYIREKEILAWLKNNKVDNYVIIDDDIADIKSLEDKLIKTKFNEPDAGLTKEKADKAIKELLKR